jgi:hypothetical protein
VQTGNSNFGAILTVRITLQMAAVLSSEKVGIHMANHITADLGRREIFPKHGVAQHLTQQIFTAVKSQKFYFPHL